MKKITATLLSASCLVLISTASHAEKRWPNWYLGLHGALTFVGEQDLNSSSIGGALEQDNGAGYGVSLGYRPRIETGEWSNMRLEVEWHHQRGDIDTVGGATSAGSVRANSGLFNVFYDAETSMPEWRPYVGLGLGFADLQLKNTPGVAASGSEDTVFAWNAMIGLGYVPTWMPFTELTAGYRYFSTSDGEFATAAGSKFEMEYDSHNIEAGMKFLF
ncbi:MAG: outer membrane beta-barrel protein [Rickettsiales bacterium]|nr:outer membrane beta-barrel protein [Rickettsiales bacterium]